VVDGVAEGKQVRGQSNPDFSPISDYIICITAMSIGPGLYRDTSLEVTGQIRNWCTESTNTGSL
jgi:hypothetical protein